MVCQLSRYLFLKLSEVLSFRGFQRNQTTHNLSSGHHLGRLPPGVPRGGTATLGQPPRGEWRRVRGRVRRAAATSARRGVRRGEQSRVRIFETRVNEQ